MEVVYALVSCVCLGLHNGMAKKPLQDMSPSQLFFIREIIVVFFTGLLLGTDVPDINYDDIIVKKNLIGIVLAGAIGYFVVVFLYKGIQVGNPGLVTTIANSYLLPVTIISWILGDVPPLSFLPKGLLILLGFLLVSWPKSDMEKKNTKGIWFGFYALIIYSFMFVLYKPATIALGPVYATFIMRLSGFVIVSLALVIRREKISLPKRWRGRTFILGLLMTAVMIAMSFAFAVDEANILVIVAIVGSAPIVTIIYDRFFNKGKISKKQFAGVLSTITGIGLPM